MLRVLSENGTTPEIVAGVKGHLYKTESRFLYEVPAQLGEGIYIDLGTFCGKSAVLLAGGIREAKLNNSKVHTVDTFKSEGMTRGRGRDTFDIAKTNIKNKELQDIVELHKLSTVEASKLNWRGPIKFVFIDADHRYEGVKRDFYAWEGLVDRDGYIAFHDSDTPGVKKFLEECYWHKRGQIHSLSWWSRQ